MEPVSPELVLVDPALSERARSGHMPPEDTLARVELLVQSSRIASLARRSIDAPARRTPAFVKSQRRLPCIGLRRSAILAGATAAGALVLLVGVRVDLRGTPAVADTVVIDAPLVDSRPAPPKTSDDETFQQLPQPGRLQPASIPVPQRFAWAPAPDASGYHVELFRGPSKVFEADTSVPSVSVPVRWTFARRSHALIAGEYRWYVWPLVAGRRAARAIVQAKLEIPTS